MSIDPGQDLKPLFQRVEPSGTALQDRIMNNIGEKPIKKERFFVKNRVSLLLLAGMLLTASTGFAAVKYQSLANDKGEILFQEKPFSTAPASNRTEDEKKRISRMNEIWVNDIKPGEAAIIYVVPNNPNHVIDLKATSHIVKNFAELKKLLHVPGMPLSKKLSGSGTYTFQQASVHMEHGMDLNTLSEEEKTEIAKKLLAQAQASGKEYSLMPVNFTDDFWLSSLTYASGKNEISLSILNAKNTGPVTASYEDELNSTSQKIKIHGQDVIQRTYRGDSTELIWIYEEPETSYVYHYTLSVRKGNISPEELIRIAETIIPGSKH